MKPGLVSILMPAYNGVAYIQQAIASVIAQSYTDWELVIVDDGSTDATAQIVVGYQDPRIRYVFQENRGQAAALNQGLALAEGEFITTLDVDDWLTVESLAGRVQHLNRHPEHSAVYGDGFYCDANGKLLMRFSDYRAGDIAGDVYSTLICSPFFGTGANVMLRRELLDRHWLRYDESIVWCQDYDLYVRIAEVGLFGVVPTPTVWYRLHDANMTNSMPFGRRLESLIAMRQKILQSPRFAALPDNAKADFFHSVLNQELCGREADQIRWIESAPFQALPNRLQARILRLTAHTYLAHNQSLAHSRNLLRWSWKHDPFAPQTAVAVALAYMSPRLAEHAMRRWQRMQSDVGR